MKHRTFLATLALFLIVFYLGIFAISVMTFQDAARRAKEISLDGHALLSAMLAKELQALESRGGKAEDAVADLLQSYAFFLGNPDIKLALYKEKDLVFSSRRDEDWPQSLAAAPAGGERAVTLRRSGGRAAAWASGALPEPYDSYTLVYGYDATETFSLWRKTKNAMFAIGAVLSVLLASGLLYLLHRLFRPLAEITRTSREIAAGAYGTRLPAAGKDELAELAGSFNHMAKEIQRRMSELAEAAAQKQRFIDNFAHELRTPLTAIYGYAEYLQKASVSEDDRLSALHYIMSESRRLLAMAGQLLELAGLGRDTPDWKPQSVSDLFRHARQTLQNKLAEKSIAVRWIEEVDTIDGDGDLLRSLLVNLLDNAAGACGEGGTIVVRAALEDGKKVLSVTDNGCGMEPEELARITEPFYRGNTPRRRRKDGGAGLGLSICRQIAERHGARLTFSSRPGEGTTAKVVFTTS